MTYIYEYIRSGDSVLLRILFFVYLLNTSLKMTYSDSTMSARYWDEIDWYIKVIQYRPDVCHSG